MTGAIAVMSSYGGGPLGPTPFDFYNPPQLVSASFNGTTQNLAVAANAALTLGTNDHTIEFWMNQTSRGGYAVPWAYDGTAAQLAGNYYVLIVGGLAFSLMLGNGAGGYAVNLALSPTPSLNAWHHYAIVRSGTTFTVYVDGVSVGSTTSSQSIPAQVNPMYIGYQSANGRVAGYISNLRVANGTAVYTGTFTPPIKPLTPTGATLYLSLGVTAFVDYSTNALAVTNTGTVALADQSPFTTTWTDSISAIAGTVAVRPNATSTSRPTYDARYGGGINIAQASQSYLDVPTSYNGAGAFTISMAANIPAAQGSHYVGIFDGNTIDRTGSYINSRQWVGDGLEVGGQGVWGASNSTTDPAMGTLAWWDFVYNGRFISVYKNGSLVTGFNNYDMGAGNANTGWLNPLRFAGDESVSSNNTMWPGTLYRAKCQPGALSAGQITTQYNAVKATYGL